MADSAEELDPEPYSPEEMHEMMQKDRRLFLAMARLAAQRQKTSVEMNRLAMFLYASIKKNGPISVGPMEAQDFKENFRDFTLDRKEKEFIMDIRRIILEAPAPNGTEDNQSIPQ